MLFGEFRKRAANTQRTESKEVMKSTGCGFEVHVKAKYLGLRKWVKAVARLSTRTSRKKRVLFGKKLKRR
jgi:hypothetical protein